MPLMRVEVKNEYGLGAPEMYTEVNNREPKEIFQGIAVSGLVGVLRQLGDLADFAAKVFHCLQEQVMETCSRSCTLMVRVQRIEVTLVPVEKAVLAQQSHLHLAYTAGVNWHAPSRCEENHFVYSDMPQYILDSYEDCRSPPHFYLLDRFDPGGPGSCLKRYSDPTIFSNASVASSDARTQKVTRDVNVQKSKTLNVQINRAQEQGFCSSYSDTWGEKAASIEPAMEDYGHDTSLESFITRLDLETLDKVIEAKSEKQDISESGSLVQSPPSSRPLAHMKMFGQRMDGFETLKMKLKCMDGDIIDQTSIDIFPSFQLVPEVLNTQLNAGSVSDDDTGSSLPDDFDDHQSGSEYEQLESSRTHGSEDHGFFDSLCRISLAESIEKKRGTCLEVIHENYGLQYSSVENSRQTSLDCQSLRIQNKFEKESRKHTNSIDLLEPEFATYDPPPLPPLQWWAVKPPMDTTENINAMHKALNSASDPKHSPSSSSEQHELAPINHDRYLEQKSKPLISEKPNAQREANQGNNIDGNNFLNQIRTRSLSLRPTVPAKLVPLRSSTNIRVMTILDKAKAIRQAVGSDDGDNWSET